jgi:hypothetical protein
MSRQKFVTSGIWDGFRLRHLGLLFICITLEPCLSVNDGQKQTGRYELDEVVDNNDKADILAVLHEFLIGVSISSSCPYLCVANFIS